MVRCAGMSRCMLSGRVVTASDVATVRATSQVEPPSTGLLTLGTSGATWRDLDINRLIGHVCSPPRDAYVVWFKSET
jgi:hypothetical protein